MSDKSMSDALRGALQTVGKEWRQAKRREDRISRPALSRMRVGREGPSIREVAFNVMENAYNKASSNGRFYANARQVYYAARPSILQATGKEALDSRYFTQTLIKDYVEEYAPGWKLVWDARGHFQEPHTGKIVDVGGIGVVEYMKAWTNGAINESPTLHSGDMRIRTVGPKLRYSAVLFIEKEGFAPILEDAGIGRRYDIAIMSTKGIPVGAACQLANRLHAQGIPLLALHDFDLAGFKIVKTFREGTRLESGTPVVDLGLRMGDIEELQGEPVYYKQRSDPGRYLRNCGATAEEVAFLVRGRDWDDGGWNGERVELNALTSEELVTWLEKKLQQHGVKKVMPGGALLKSAYKRAVFIQTMQERADDLEAELEEDLKGRKIATPKQLERKVAEILKGDSSLSWDDAIWRIAEPLDEEEDGS